MFCSTRKVNYSYRITCSVSKPKAHNRLVAWSGSLPLPHGRTYPISLAQTYGSAQLRLPTPTPLRVPSFLSPNQAPLRSPWIGCPQPRQLSSLTLRMASMATRSATTWASPLWPTRRCLLRWPDDIPETKFSISSAAVEIKNSLRQRPRSLAI
ncbi:hypothetical protein U9M48_026315 [Paspalum notatum var. saurae]|uniref:Uncharacterized protein n=1 Tax=Paspalum notatum var. saurae TaxID=547442 RepID=A0AAQ3TSK1_PASNO